MAIEAATDGVSHTEILSRWHAEIAIAAQRFSIPEAWIAAVIGAESNGQTEVGGRPITSPKGAMGLMQLMPPTYAEMRRLYGLGDDPYVPGDNILAGAAYLRLNLDRFGYPGLFAAYNAGPERYARSLNGHGLPAETRDYLRKVTRATTAQAPAPDSIFVNLGDPVAPSESSVVPSVFVPLTIP
ncbi:lytic transglycosylase domain-containing protein [Asticcacaulis sp. MM231]|uniref:lytic transglycosylase domain-containing protein n=1 Tax=Asticcacaulis sp. MM231 TaxID=3157666 RepID=UPI0032D58434